MEENHVTFYSDGCKLYGTYFFDEAKLDPKLPTVLVCSGFLGLQVIHPARFARFLTPAGYRCFSFDYRGFGQSSGRGAQVYLENQIADVRNALYFVVADQQDCTHPTGVVLIGWGMGAGIVLSAANYIDQVNGIVCLNGFYNGERFLRFRHGDNWPRLMAWARSQGHEQVREDAERTYDPFQIYTLDNTTDGYVNIELKKYSQFGGRVTLRFLDSLLYFRPEQQLGPLTNVPLFIGHGGKNALHSPKEAESLYRLYPGPKQLYWIPDSGHTEWMLDDNTKFQALIAELITWLDTL